ncbi:hypothetical protein [Caproicibacter fermentans]|uniref:hypothetical protein n=1 Tax=Caproicibacter fermentans TaxID=2576756 RepID=UPI0012EE939E|nr:hypothetical protein [Caproicibacter fermentans]
MGEDSLVDLGVLAASAGHAAEKTIRALAAKEMIFFDNIRKPPLILSSTHKDKSGRLFVTKIMEKF